MWIRNEVDGNPRERIDPISNAYRQNQETETLKAPMRRPFRSRSSSCTPAARDGWSRCPCRTWAPRCPRARTSACPSPSTSFCGRRAEFSVWCPCSFRMKKVKYVALCFAPSSFICLGAAEAPLRDKVEERRSYLLLIFVLEPNEKERGITYSHLQRMISEMTF